MTSFPAFKSGSGSHSGANEKRLLSNNNNINDHGLQPPRGLGLSEPPISPAVTTGTTSSGNFTDIHMRQLVRPKKFRTLSNASSILSDIFNHPDANEDELKDKIKEANDRDREALNSMNESLRSSPHPPPEPLLAQNVDEDKKHRGGLWGLFRRKSFKAAKKRVKSAPPKIVVPEPLAASRVTKTTHTTEDGQRQTVISIPAQRTVNLGPIPRSPGFGLSPKSPITGTPIRPPRPSIGLETLLEQQESNERHSLVPKSAPVIPPINDGLKISPLLPIEDFNRLQRVSGFIVPPVETSPELPQSQEVLVDEGDDEFGGPSSGKIISCQDHTLPEFVSPASPLHLSVCLSTGESSRDRRSKMSSGFKLPDHGDHAEEPMDRGLDGGETLAEVSALSSSSSSYRKRLGSADVSSLSSVASSADKPTGVGSTDLRRQRSLHSNPSSFNKRMALERSDSIGGMSIKSYGNQSTEFHTPPDLPSGYATEPDARELSSALERVQAGAVQLPPLRFTSVMTVADVKPLSCKTSSNLRPSPHETKKEDGEAKQASATSVTKSLPASTSVASSSTPQATPLSAPSSSVVRPLQLRRTNGIICPPLRLSSSNHNSRSGVPRSGSHLDILQQCEDFRHSKEQELDSLRERLRQLENRNSWLLTAVTKQLPGGCEYEEDDTNYGNRHDDMEDKEEERGRPHSRSTMNITSSRASASDRWSMTSQHTFGSTIDDSVAGTGFSSSNLTTGSRLIPPEHHTQHPRYNPSPVTTTNYSSSGSGSGSGSSSNASLSAVRLTPTTPRAIPIAHSKPTLVTRSYKTCSSTAIPVFSNRNVGSSNGHGQPSLSSTAVDANKIRERRTSIPRPIQAQHILLSAAAPRRERSLPRDPRLASFGSRSRSKDEHMLGHRRNKSLDGHLHGPVECGSNNATDDKSNNGRGSGSRTPRSTSRTPAPLPPSLTYNGQLPSTAAQRREAREYRKKQEEIMRRIAETPGGTTLGHSSSSTSMASLTGGQKLQGESGYETYNDGRDPLTRLRDLRENVGRAISGIGIGLAVTSDDDGNVYDGYSSGEGYRQYHRNSGCASFDGYGQGSYDGYVVYDNGYAYGSTSGGHELGEEWKDKSREGRYDEAEGQGNAEEDGERNYTLSKNRTRYHHQRDSPLPFEMPSWPSLPTLPSLPSLAGPSHSSFETEEWFPSMYRTQTQQTQTQPQGEDDNYGVSNNTRQSAANSNGTNNTANTNDPNRRTIRRKTTIAAINGNKPPNKRTDEWETLEPLMRELIGNGGNSTNEASRNASGVDDSSSRQQQRSNHNDCDAGSGQSEITTTPPPSTTLVDKVFGFSPMSEKDMEEEALEGSVNLLQ
ncbi:hypothetical protein B0T20DRAFT_447637 [Sordaria brevicollis]|uniref:Uncharacterized protein n=1 Tax=Sordaria brevicollis TaxID=83679 RepID=A0AAE0NWY5_SORBR|nr:hypothetical protein B0T20DRAFT_447637 [Sordaria brevicollis]